MRAIFAIAQHELVSIHPLSEPTTFDESEACYIMIAKDAKSNGAQSYSAGCTDIVGYFYTIQYEKNPIIIHT